MVEQKDTPQEEKSGLTADQVDQITLQICHARALAKVLHENSDETDETDSNLFPLLLERLEKVEDMVVFCKIGRR